MLDTGPLQRAGADFRRVASLVLDDQWETATPCENWTVRQLVGHVVGGSKMSAAVAGGARRNDAIRLIGTDHLGSDPMTALAAALDEELAALSAPDVEHRVVEHPAGDMPAAQLLQFRIGDLVIHQWDLARAIGVGERLDDDLVQHVWDGLQPMRPMIAQTGVFGEGPSGTVPDGAPLQERLLDLTGRRPSHQPTRDDPVSH